MQNGLEVLGEGWNRHEALAGIRISEPTGTAPRTLTFADATYCEVPQGKELDDLLLVLGHRDGAVVRWQASWRMAMLALLVMGVMIVFAYRWGLPWAAAKIAPQLPDAAVAKLSDGVLEMLDRQTLAPSRLTEPRQSALARGFQALAAADPSLGKVQLHFRHGGALGPNAFALPDGEVVLLDELVELADDDTEVLAVLGHELGHVKYRHGVRQLIQSSVVALVVASYLGDISSLLTGMGTLLLESNYSREFELEADRYGAALLRATGHSAEPLATMLKKLDDAHARQRAEGSSASLLSTHPDTNERIRRLRDFALGA